MRMHALIALLMVLSCSVGQAANPSTASIEKTDNALAGPLLVVLSEHLGGRPVVMRLENVAVRPNGMYARTISGVGSLCIEGQQDWMGFRFQAAYDTRLDRTDFPEVSIGGIAAGEHEVPNDPMLVRALDERVALAMTTDQRLPAVRLQLDRIVTVEAGTRYLNIHAEGLADFGAGGAFATRIEGFYDRLRNEWLRVHYELDDTAGSAMAPLVAR